MAAECKERRGPHLTDPRLALRISNDLFSIRLRSFSVLALVVSDGWTAHPRPASRMAPVRRFQPFVSKRCATIDPNWSRPPLAGAAGSRWSQARRCLPEADLAAAAGDRLHRRLPSGEEITRAQLVFLARTAR